ncbi:MAG: hypothetical protein ACOC30_01840 [Marinilabilia sp.]
MQASGKAERRELKSCFTAFIFENGEAVKTAPLVRPKFAQFVPFGDKKYEMA